MMKAVTVTIDLIVEISLRNIIQGNLKTLTLVWVSSVL
jgi:hypothetical protein